MPSPLISSAGCIMLSSASGDGYKTNVCFVSTGVNFEPKVIHLVFTFVELLLIDLGIA